MDLENRIIVELDAAGILNEKARRFFLYVICRTLPDLQIENKGSENDIIRRYIRLLPGIDFPFFNTDRKLLILPSEVILDEVLYSDRDLSMFFILYARFCLLLEILHEIYPSWFDFLSRPPYWVPAFHMKIPVKGDDAMFHAYRNHARQSSIPGKENIIADVPEDNRLGHILNQLAGSWYLPFSSDFTVHNKSIFSAIIRRSTL